MFEGLSKFIIFLFYILFILGHDTTSSGMAWTFWCLAHNLEAQKKVLQELDMIFGFYITLV